MTSFYSFCLFNWQHIQHIYRFCSFSFFFKVLPFFLWLSIRLFSFHICFHLLVSLMGKDTIIRKSIGVFVFLPLCVGWDTQPTIVRNREKHINSFAPTPRQRWLKPPKTKIWNSTTELDRKLKIQIAVGKWAHTHTDAFWTCVIKWLTLPLSEIELHQYWIHFRLMYLKNRLEWRKNRHKNWK